MLNGSNFIKELKKQKTFSKKIRLYVVTENKHYLMDQGIVRKGFDSSITLKKNRDSVLSAFSKMAFLFDELIRIRIVGYSNSENSNELLYLLNLIPINRKIRTFLDWKVFGPDFTRNMSRLFEVRNDTMHCISINDVQYVPKNTISLASESGFNKFSQDFQNAWRQLLEIYTVEQEKLNFENILEIR